jgi:3-isopropylmalate/(R)-2-methylmalate dehydratase small subunit
MAIDLGLPILISPEVASAAKEAQVIEVDTKTGKVILDGKEFQAEPMPSFIQEIIDMGGVTDWVKAEVARRKATPGSAGAGAAR